MKKILLPILVLCFSFSNLFSQSSLLVADVTSSLTITNGMIINKTVSGGNSDNFYFSIKNTSGGTKTYKMTKFYDLRNIVSPGDSAYATFQFCGFHYAPATNTSVCSVTLTANQTDASPVAEFSEASLAGRTDVRWRIYEINNPSSDFTEFTLRYNDASAGIKNLSESISSMSEIFPCPTNSNASITIHAEEPTCDVSLIISNTLGSIISFQNYELAKGINHLTIDVNQFESGVYFITLTGKDLKLQRKLVIEK